MSDQDQHSMGHPNVPGQPAHLADAHGEHAEHGLHGGIAKYIYVFVALCILTGASFFTYSDYWPFHATPQIGWAFMMAVSCTKAMLVILFFMHVKYEANWKYVLTIPAAFMSIFLILALVPDVGLRGRHVSEEREQYMAEPVSAASHGAESAPTKHDRPSRH
jgi:cytochrome c oxidase subunit 4